MRPRLRRYLIELTGVVALYAAALVTLNLAPVADWPVSALLALALLPAGAAILLVAVVLRFVRTLDEVRRRVVTEAALAAMVLVGLASFAYAFVQEALGLPEIGLVWVWPALIACTRLAQAPISWRLR